MNEIIKITQHNGNSAVSARELHQFLGSKQQFGNWIINRITEYGFIENQDFEVFNNSIKNLQGGRPTTEYILTMDMAKELAMVERNAKGKEARQYFIACEKLAKEGANYNNYMDGRSDQVKSLFGYSAKVHVQHQRVELLHLIKQNLFYGDLADLAREKELNFSSLRSCLCGKMQSERYLKIMYEKALQNKAKKQVQYNLMILNLKN